MRKLIGFPIAALGVRFLRFCHMSLSATLSKDGGPLERRGSLPYAWTWWALAPLRLAGRERLDNVDVGHIWRFCARRSRLGPRRISAWHHVAAVPGWKAFPPRGELARSARPERAATETVTRHVAADIRARASLR